MSEIDVEKEYVRQEVYEAHAYIIEHCTEPLDWQCVGEKVGLSGNYLRTLYSEAYDVSLSQTLTKYRMRYAAELLIGTRGSIREIRDSVLYNSTSYFSRIFKTQYGMTPRQFRRERRTLSF